MAEKEKANMQTCRHDEHALVVLMLFLLCQRCICGARCPNFVIGIVQACAQRRSSDSKTLVSMFFCFLQKDQVILKSGLDRTR